MPADLPTIAATFRDLPPLGQVETDRFCAGCGYNLRQQAVRREPATNLLLVQCPECGAFDPVGRDTTVSRLWLAWLVRLLLVLWVAAVGLLAWIASAAAFVMFYELGRSGVWLRWNNGQYNVQARVDDGWLMLEQGLVLTALAVTAWVTVSLMAVLLPHWRRWGYGLALLVLVGGAGSIAGLNLHGYFHRSATAAEYWPGVLGRLWLGAGVGLAAGGLAVFLARPVVRGVVRVLVPPKMRPPLAYLWHVDGRTPPIPKPARS